MIPYIISFTMYIMLIHIVWHCMYSDSSAKSVRLLSNIGLFIFSSLPIILFYGLRVNVGTDYLSYVDMYNEIKTIPMLEYLKLFLNNRAYSEPAYYLINRFAYLILDNEHTVFLLTGGILFGLFYFALLKYDSISRSYAAFIFLMTQFCYAVNGVRFALAYTVVLVGIKYIIEEKPVKFIICIFIAAMFHKSAICCLAFYLLKQFKNQRLTKIRDLLFYCGVACTPVMVKFGLQIASKIPFIDSYYRRYSVDYSSGGGFLYLWRCVPPMLAVVLLTQIYHIQMERYRVLLNIELCRIPLLYLGKYAPWASRMDRYAWMSEIILVAFVIYHIRDRRQKLMVVLCFTMWYAFVFFVYYIIQTTDIFPYRSVFSIY